MSYRTHPLYRRAREVGGQPIDWTNPTVARLQYEMRHDFTERTPTLSLITQTAGAIDAQAMMMTLTEIMAQPEQSFSMPARTLDGALGEGRN